MKTRGFAWCELTSQTELDASSLDDAMSANRVMSGYERLQQVATDCTGVVSRGGNRMPPTTNVRNLVGSLSASPQTRSFFLFELLCLFLFPSFRACV